jgi:hypothetical protein
MRGMVGGPTSRSQDRADLLVSRNLRRCEVTDTEVERSARTELEKTERAKTVAGAPMATRSLGVQSPRIESKFKPPDPFRIFLGSS